MGKLSQPPESISKPIDRIEEVREELLAIQRSMVEAGKKAPVDRLRCRGFAD
jgi:hypothetical protein